MKLRKMETVNEVINEEATPRHWNKIIEVPSKWQCKDMPREELEKLLNDVEATMFEYMGLIGLMANFPLRLAVIDKLSRLQDCRKMLIELVIDKMI